MLCFEQTDVLRCLLATGRPHSLVCFERRCEHSFLEGAQLGVGGKPVLTVLDEASVRHLAFHETPGVAGGANDLVAAGLVAIRFRLGVTGAHNGGEV